MSNTDAPKKPKSKSGNSGTVAIRVRPETKNRIIKELARINKEKSFGRRIKADDYLGLAISLICVEHVKRLKEASMSNRDRVELAYLDYVKANGQVTKDEFYGLLLNGKIAPIKGELF